MHRTDIELLPFVKMKGSRDVSERKQFLNFGEAAPRNLGLHQKQTSGMAVVSPSDNLTQDASFAPAQKYADPRTSKLAVALARYRQRRYDLNQLQSMSNSTSQRSQQRPNRSPQTGDNNGTLNLSIAVQNGSTYHSSIQTGASSSRPGTASRAPSTAPSTKKKEVSRI